VTLDPIDCGGLGRLGEGSRHGVCARASGPGRGSCLTTVWLLHYAGGDAENARLEHILGAADCSPGLVSARLERL